MNLMQNRRISLWMIFIVLFVWIINDGTNVVSASFQNLGIVVFIKTASAQAKSPSDIAGIARWFEIALDVQSDNARPMRSLGLALWRSGDLENGWQWLEEYYKTKTSDNTIRLFWGDMAYEKGDFRAAMQFWSSIHAGVLFAARASYLLDAGDLENARRLLDISRLTGPASYNLGYSLAINYTELAEKYRVLGDKAREIAACDGADDAYRLALDFEPGHSSLRIRYGVLLRECGRYSEALAQLQKVINEETSFSALAWAQQEMGLIDLLLGDATSAVEHLEKAVQLEPEHGGYRIVLGNTRAKLGDFAQALRDFQEVIDTTKNIQWQGWAYAEMGKVYMTRGDLVNAQRAYEHAVAMEPNRADYRVQLGIVLAKNGDIEAARAQFMQALASDHAAWKAWAQRELDRLSQDELNGG